MLMENDFLDLWLVTNLGGGVGNGNLANVSADQAELSWLSPQLQLLQMAPLTLTAFIYYKFIFLLLIQVPTPPPWALNNLACC